MDAETQDLLKASIRDLFDSDDGDIVTGLQELGWSEVVAEDAEAATDLLFTSQGEAGKASAADLLDHVHRPPANLERVTSPDLVIDDPAQASAWPGG